MGLLEYEYNDGDLNEYQKLAEVASAIEALKIEARIEAKAKYDRHCKSYGELGHFKTKPCTDSTTCIVYGFLKSGVTGVAHFGASNGNMKRLFHDMRAYGCYGFVIIARHLTRKQARNIKLCLQRHYKPDCQI
jgi:hypothetical protein